MVSPARKASLSILMVLLLSALACQLPNTSIETPTIITVPPPATHTSTVLPGTPLPTISAQNTQLPTALADVYVHRIAIHRIYGIAGFYNRNNSQVFIPRGVNYSILVPILNHYEDRLFGVGFYDHDRTQGDFKQISDAGYNTVRMIIDGCSSGDGCIGQPDGEGLNPLYLDNMVDLMSLAKANDLYLILASSALPEQGGYKALANVGANDQIEAGRNAEVLTITGIQGAQKYWTELFIGLISRQAPLEIVLGWELQSEQHYRSDQLPFTLDDGKVVIANGKSYDLSNARQKQALAVDGLRFYIEQLRRTILEFDPTALVTMGFIAPEAPNPWREGDERLVVTASLIQNSALDFFDFHASPRAGLSMPELAQNFGLEGHVTKPVVMGEVGASTWTYPQIADGAIAVQDWIAASCGFNFTGWLYQGYYPNPAGMQEATWGMVDGRNSILLALSPRKQPDACESTVLPGRNLALGKQVTVSAALVDQPAYMAVDGDPNTQWSAGAYPTQWIEVDLGAAHDIAEIRLTVGQWPEGAVLHQLWLGGTRETMQMVFEFSGEEFDFDVLQYLPASPLAGIRYVRIVTSESPSWVSWREVEVLAPFPATPTPAGTATTTPTP